MSLVRFDCKVDWHERHRFLKFAAPVDIRSDSASYDTQFGFINRPTHRNTTWDRAKFEVCGHKYADLSGYGYGVALLNDCKYGYAVEGNVLRLSLLRGATYPDPQQDQGEHTFAFAIMPHAGHFIQSEVQHVARSEYCCTSGPARLTSHQFSTPLCICESRISKSPRNGLVCMDLSK